MVWWDVINAASLTKRGRDMWDLRLTRFNALGLREVLKVNQGSTGLSILDLTKNKWKLVKSNRRERRIKFCLRCSTGDEIQVRKTLADTIGRAWAREMDTMRLTRCGMGRDIRYDGTIMTRFPYNLCTSLTKKARSIRPESNKNSKNKASSNCWRVSVYEIDDMYNYMMYEVLSLVYNIHPYLIKQEHVDETNIIMHNRWDILRKMSESDAVDIEREERRSMYPAQMKH